MHPNLLPAFSLLVMAVLTLIHIPASFSQDQQYVSCGQTFRCGDLTFDYPFWGDNRPSSCGYPGFELSCETSVVFLASESLRYRVLSILSSEQRITVARNDLWSNLCPRFINETAFNSTIFSYSSGIQNVTVGYDCNVTNSATQPNRFDCNTNSTSSSNNTSFFSTNGINPAEAVCTSSISVPFYPSRTGNLTTLATLRGALNGGFGLQWEANNLACEQCTLSGGRCGYNSTSTPFVCYCADRPYGRTCFNTQTPSSGPGSRSLSSRVTVPLVTASSLIGLILSVAGVYYLVKRRPSGAIWGKLKKENNQNIEAFIRNYGSLAPKCYKFSEIKRMTNSFAHQLGQGGYGFVYKGTLPDGRQVAVKVLKDIKGDGEVFINEVASISRTSHVNVVTFLGFCYKDNTRALVYDFMSNGSLDKFLCKNIESQEAGSRLEWKVLYQIALGTARGLEYLHQGCNTRIVHFDIKPQNILLDKDFCPKISDFGLARLCQKKESVLSTMAARGTVGYIAPEVVFRCFGSVSHKSDVYSYGMMVLEMVGLKSRIHVAATEKGSETYFPNWIYERLELEKDLELEGVMNEEEEEGARKMIVVGLWCIQPNPSDRPPMDKVVEMLEGSVESLQIPPKPYLLDSPAAAIMSSIQESSETLFS